MDITRSERNIRKYLLAITLRYPNSLHFLKADRSEPISDDREMKDQEQGWGYNLKMMQPGAHLPICDEEDLKEKAGLEDPLTARLDTQFDLSVSPFVHQLQMSGAKPARVPRSGPPRPRINLEEMYEKQKSMDKRQEKHDDLACMCCNINGTCVGIVGVFLLLAMAIALLSVPGAGRMPETVPIVIKNSEEFMKNYNNDPYNYTLSCVKHIRSYTRWVLIRKDDIPKTFISITTRLGHIDDYLVKDPGITQLLFERLPYERYFERDPRRSDVLSRVLSVGGSLRTTVGFVSTTIDVELPHDQVEGFFRLFNKYYGFGETSVPRSVSSWIQEEYVSEGNREVMLALLPAAQELYPK